MAWVYLVAAGLFEIGWATALKYADGFTKPAPSAIVVVCLVASMGLLGLALKSMPLGTAYAVWTGIGTLGTVLCGIMLFGEATDMLRIGSIALIVAGIIGLKLAHSS